MKSTAMWVSRGISAGCADTYMEVWHKKPSRCEDGFGNVWYSLPISEGLGNVLDLCCDMARRRVGLNIKSGECKRVRFTAEVLDG